MENGNFVVGSDDKIKGRGYFLASDEITTRDNLNEILRLITVRISSEEALGSGTILHNDGTKYYVLTNSHILSGTSPPYFVQTPDGENHLASVVEDLSNHDIDAVILLFNSSSFSYEVARQGRFDTTQPGELVFSAGFICPQNGDSFYNLEIRTGEITYIVSPPLEDGYRIAYTNRIDMGMSGGPLINDRGEVIGINGLRSNPLWDISLRYTDGIEVSPHLQELLSNYSLAIPLSTVLETTDILK
jgi:S1-C subfamily serine protease